jgi:hypothetical protein
MCTAMTTASAAAAAPGNHAAAIPDRLMQTQPQKLPQMASAQPEHDHTLASVDVHAASQVQ